MLYLRLIYLYRNSHRGHIGGRYSGLGEVQEYFDYFINETKVIQNDFHFKTIIAEGDMVVAIGRENFTVKATGKEYDGAFTLVFHFSDGKISRYHVFGDNSVVECFNP